LRRGGAVKNLDLNGMLERLVDSMSAMMSKNPDWRDQASAVTWMLDQAGMQVQGRGAGDEIPWLWQGVAPLWSRKLHVGEVATEDIGACAGR
jgi:hypothetical protein